MKYDLQNKVITTKIITDVKGELKLIDKGIKGVIVDIDVTATTTQPYLVKFEETIIKGCGNVWWAFEEDITKL